VSQVRCSYCGALTVGGFCPHPNCLGHLANGNGEPDSAEARRTDPETSHEAAASVGDTRPSQQAVLKMFQDYGEMCDEELLRLATAAFLRQSPSGLRTRRRELVDKGLLKDSGRRGLTPAGRRTIIWELA